MERAKCAGLWVQLNLILHSIKAVDTRLKKLVLAIYNNSTAKAYCAPVTLLGLLLATFCQLACERLPFYVPHSYRFRAHSFDLGPHSYPVIIPRRPPTRQTWPHHFCLLWFATDAPVCTWCPEPRALGTPAFLRIIVKRTGRCSCSGCTFQKMF